MDCNFDQGACEWLQDKADDMDWSVAYHDHGNKITSQSELIIIIFKQFLTSIHFLGAEYYMAMIGLLGEPGDVAKLKLLLNDRAQQGSFCLTFDYRVVGHKVGTLRVLLGNNVYPIWEQSQSRNQAWQTEFLIVAWKEKAPEMVGHT